MWVKGTSANDHNGIEFLESNRMCRNLSFIVDDTNSEHLGVIY